MCYRGVEKRALDLTMSLVACEQAESQPTDHRLPLQLGSKSRSDTHRHKMHQQGACSRGCGCGEGTPLKQGASLQTAATAHQHLMHALGDCGCGCGGRRNAKRALEASLSTNGADPSLTQLAAYLAGFAHALGAAQSKSGDGEAPDLLEQLPLLFNAAKTLQGWGVDARTLQGMYQPQQAEVGALLSKVILMPASAGSSLIFWV